MKYSDVNKELLLGFVDESIDALSEVDTLFVELEKSPDCIEIIGAIFRPIHSLKGNAAYFGLMQLKKLAHCMENLLDQIRKKIKKVDSSIINALLPGLDQLREILLNVREDREEISDRAKYSSIVDVIEIALNEKNIAGNSILQSEIAEIINELRKGNKDGHSEKLDQLISLLSKIQIISGVDKNEQKPVFPSGCVDKELNAVIEELTEKIKEISNKKSSSITSDILYMLIEKLHGKCETDWQKKTVDDIADIFNTFNNSDAGIDQLAESLLLEKLQVLQLKKDENASSVQTENEHQKNDIKEQHLKTDKTMRIPEKALDDFLRSVGELLGVEEMLRHLQRKCVEKGDISQMQVNLKEAISQFEAISGELRSKIMEIRKVEAKQLLQKVPRIVRDIASSRHKKINIICIGNEVAIDKSYIDLLDAPLTHMVRNAADHGIELPEERIKKNKDEFGTVTVTLVEDEEDLKLIVKDDGAGLNHAGIKKKAVELGIIKNDEELSTDQITDLLFYSGVSTAQEVTDISGRGVGMDVVKKAITGAAGKIEVQSLPNCGTTFTITLPRNASTQIMDGYVVESFVGEVYVIPLSNVIEAFRIEPDQINSVAGKGTTIQRRSGLNPLYILDTLLGFGSTGDPRKKGRCMGVLVETKKGKSVIAVKEIVGIQKVVSKKIEGGLLKSTQFDGAAVSGTGHIYMIVNVEKMLGIELTGVNN
jgi:two-component system chemotaxis sensor kinase CheA